MGVGNDLRGARERAGLSIRALAERAGVAPSTVWRVERGLINPTVRMLSRLLDATTSERASMPQTREQTVSLALGRLAASALLLRPEEILVNARRRVDEQLDDLDVPRGARHLLARWEEMLDGPIEDIVLVLIEPSESAHELRSVTPFVGIHSDHERLAAIRSSRHAG